MKIESLNTKCVGCGACSGACPNDSIKMLSDKEGFLCPVIGDGCVKCGICDSVCPVINLKTESIEKPKAYVCYNNNEEERLASSSGGIFVLLAKLILKAGGVVYGAAVNTDCAVKHIRVDSELGIAPLLGSKYVQSQIDRGIYQSIKADLKNGRKVLFCGTPCQTAAVSAFAKGHDNLFLATFICHGVPSPKMWSEYVAMKENEFNSKCIKTSFRNKAEGWAQFSLEMQFDNGIVYRANLRNDPFLKAFLHNLDLRESCYDCAFKGLGNQKGADLILADWWGYVKSVLPGAADDKGVSSVFVMNKKGSCLWDSISADCTFAEYDFEKISKSNINYTKSSNRNKARDFFMEKTNRDNFRDNAHKYGKQPFRQKVRFMFVTFAKKLGIKDFLKKLLGR